MKTKQSQKTRAHDISHSRRSFVLSILVIFSLSSFTSCTNKAGARPKRVALVTLMSHPALDEVQAKAREELARQGYGNAEVEFLVRNASGQVQLAAGIANELAAADVDLIIAVTTPMAQAVVKQARCPVVFAAVTDPVGAGIVKSMEVGETTVTGTSDAWPYEDQLKLIRELTPNVKRLGVLYNPGESASQYGIRRIRDSAEKYGFDLVEGACGTTNDVYPVAQNLAQRCDALLLSSDNTVISGVAAAVKAASAARLPLYVGDSGTVAKGGLAAVSVGYAELGTETGILAARMLRGERGIPTVVGRGNQLHVNRKSAELMNVQIPESIMGRATKVYDEIEQ